MRYSDNNNWRNSVFCMMIKDKQYNLNNTHKQMLNWNICLLLISLVVFALNQLPFLLDVRAVKYDEAWYMNPAYNLLNGNGLLNDLVGSGGNVNFVGPVLMSGCMAMFGQSLLVARLTAVICGFISLVILHLIQNEICVNKYARIGTYVIFLSIYIINSTFRNVRPEFAVALFLLIGILFAIRYHRTHKWFDIVGLSISIYLTSCSHPFALYIYALIGCSLLWDVIQTKEWKHLYQLVLPIISAVLVILSLLYLNKAINHATDSNSIMQRFSMLNALEAMCVSMKSVFIRNGVYTIPFLLVNIFAITKHREIRWLAIPNVIFVFTFPLLFSSDLHMVGNSTLYFSIVSIVLCSCMMEHWINVVHIHYNRKMIGVCCIVLYCIGNYGLSLLHNYHKYEKCNSILMNDINEYIPDNSLIFGSMRFWPFKMSAKWFCEMNRKNEVPKAYDYLIISSQDISSSDELNPQILRDVLETIENYDRVYERESKQYGLISIYKHKDIIK